MKNEVKSHDKEKVKVEVKEAKFIHAAIFKESQIKIEIVQFTVEVKATLEKLNNPTDVKEIVEYVVFERNLKDPLVSMS
jgi:hypothetical protein